MKLGGLDRSTLGRRLATDGVVLEVGPFATRLLTPIPFLADAIHLLYHDFLLLTDDTLTHFHIRVAPPTGLRGWWRPQSVFFSDGRKIFKPFPLRLALPLLEWGWNWSISAHAHQFLMVHCAVVERGGRGVMLPAPPGAGKSTLCAGLVHRGWRLLSDEMALVRLDDRTIVPLARPVSLKGAAIDVIARFAPDAVIGPRCTDTHKGTVAHLRPPADSVAAVGRRASCGWIVFPRYQAGAPATLNPLPRARAFVNLVEHSFNFSVLGRAGFDTLAQIVDGAECYEFAYGELDEAVKVFDRLAGTGPS